MVRKCSCRKLCRLLRRSELNCPKALGETCLTSDGRTLRSRHLRDGFQSIFKFISRKMQQKIKGRREKLSSIFLHGVRKTMSMEKIGKKFRKHLGFDLSHHNCYQKIRTPFTIMFLRSTCKIDSKDRKVLAIFKLSILSRGLIRILRIDLGHPLLMAEKLQKRFFLPVVKK